MTSYTVNYKTMLLYACVGNAAKIDQHGVNQLGVGRCHKVVCHANILTFTLNFC